MGRPIRDAQPEHRRLARDWSLPLVGVFVIACMTGASAARLASLHGHFDYDLFRLVAGVSLGLMGVAFGGAGMLLWRHSPHVRLLLMHFARGDPLAVGIVYVGMGAGLLVGGIAQAISAIPGEAVLFILGGGLGIIPGLLLCAYYVAKHVERRRARRM